MRIARDDIWIDEAYDAYDSYLEKCKLDEDACVQKFDDFVLKWLEKKMDYLWDC